MKDFYMADELIVANLKRFSDYTDDFGPMIQTTDQKYIFEKVLINNEVQYREIYSK